MHGRQAERLCRYALRLLSEKDMGKFLDYLAMEGFFDYALDLAGRNGPLLEGPSWKFTLQTLPGSKMVLQEQVAWNAQALERVRGFRNALSGKAATELDWLLEQAKRVEPAATQSDDSKPAAKEAPKDAKAARKRLIEIANEEAKKAYRKQHGLAADAQVDDFDFDRKPTGVWHHNWVEPNGDHCQVILQATIPKDGVRTVIQRVEVPLTREGKLCGEVKFAWPNTPLPIDDLENEEDYGEKLLTAAERQAKLLVVYERRVAKIEQELREEKRSFDQWLGGPQPEPFTALPGDYTLYAPDCLAQRALRVLIEPTTAPEIRPRSARLALLDDKLLASAEDYFNAKIKLLDKVADPPWRRTEAEKQVRKYREKLTAVQEAPRPWPR